MKMLSETRRSLSLVLLSCLVLQLVVYSAAQTGSQATSRSRASAGTGGDEEEIIAEASIGGEDGASSSASASSTVNGTRSSASASSDDDGETVEGGESTSSGEVETEVDGGTSTDSGNDNDSTDDSETGKEFAFHPSFHTGVFRPRCRHECCDFQDAAGDYYRRKCTLISCSTLISILFEHFIM